MPGRLWYAVAVAIFLAALGGAAWMVVAGVGSMGAGLLQVAVPGSADLDLDEPGAYTILQTPALGGTPAPDIAGLRVTLRAANGTDIVVRSLGTTPTDTFGPGAERSVLVFEIETAGRYRLEAAYGEGRRQPRVHLMISRGIIGGMLRIFMALGIALIGVSAAVVIVIVVSVRRRRAVRGIR